MIVESGQPSTDTYPNCFQVDSVKIEGDRLLGLAHRFFVTGTTNKYDYGAAPALQINHSERASEDFCDDKSTLHDGHLIEKLCGIKIFQYGPRLWMLGCIKPLEQLQDIKTRYSVIKTILNKFPAYIMPESEIIFRLRKNPTSPLNEGEYDAPPLNYSPQNRIAVPQKSVLFASYSPEAAIHECRVTVEAKLSNSLGLATSFSW